MPGYAISPTLVTLLKFLDGHLSLAQHAVAPASLALVPFLVRELEHLGESLIRDGPEQGRGRDAADAGTFQGVVLVLHCLCSIGLALEKREQEEEEEGVHEARRAGREEAGSRLVDGVEAVVRESGLLFPGACSGLTADLVGQASSPFLKRCFRHRPAGRRPWAPHHQQRRKARRQLLPMDQLQARTSDLPNAPQPLRFPSRPSQTASPPSRNSKELLSSTSGSSRSSRCRPVAPARCARKKRRTVSGSPADWSWCSACVRSMTGTRVRAACSVSGSFARRSLTASRVCCSDARTRPLCDPELAQRQPGQPGLCVRPRLRICLLASPANATPFGTDVTGVLVPAAQRRTQAAVPSRTEWRVVRPATGAAPLITACNTNSRARSRSEPAFAPSLSMKRAGGRRTRCLKEARGEGQVHRVRDGCKAVAPTWVQRRLGLLPRRKVPKSACTTLPLPLRRRRRASSCSRPRSIARLAQLLQQLTRRRRVLPLETRTDDRSGRCGRA